MRHPSLFVAALLASTACSASPEGSAPPANGPVIETGAPAGTYTYVPPPPVAMTSVPPNAPIATFRDVKATTGRANRAETPPPFNVETIGNFTAPFAMAFLPDGALLVTEKAGILKLRRADGTVVPVPGAPTVEKGGQGGLLDVAVAPDYAASHAIFLSYAKPASNGSELALARATLDSSKTPKLTEVTEIWRSGSAGPGGQFGAIITFAPDGKSLFLTSGERQRFTPAQDADQALGKIVRLTLDGKAFPGNPMFKAGGVRSLTWSTGHRNPYGLVFTPDGRLWSEEMGPKGGDELNLIRAGANYGWPVVSNGDNYGGQPIPDQPSKPDYAAPALWWNPVISPGGMIHYSGAMFPAYRGSLLIGALSGEALIRVSLDDDRATAADQWDMGTRIRDVAQAPDGAIWLLEDGRKGADGRLLRLTPKR